MAIGESHSVDRNALRERLAFLARWKYDLPAERAESLADELLAALEDDTAAPDPVRLVTLLNTRRPAAPDGHPARREALRALATAPAARHPTSRLQR